MNDYRTIANLFGLGRSTVSSIIHIVCKQIAKRLPKYYINLPKKRWNEKNDPVIWEWVWLSTGSSCNRLLPHLHKTTNKKSEDYINRKEYYSIVPQGLIDNRYLFGDIFVEWTGKSHDAIIFKNWSWYKLCQRRSFLPIKMLKQIGNVELSPLVIQHILWKIDLLNLTLIVAILALMKPGSTLHLAEVKLLLKMHLVVWRVVSNVLQKD